MYYVQYPGPTPLLKWAGGKTAMLPEITKRMPASFRAYHEPFAGGLALFFNLDRPGFIADSNQNLMAFYYAVALRPDEVYFKALELQSAYNTVRHEHQRKGFYYETRDRFNRAGILGPDAAALLLFLNKCSFNGLWRVNKSGFYNVPWGKKEKLNLLDETNFYRCSSALANANFCWGEYDGCLKLVMPDDFIFCDPPYFPTEGDNSFVNYSVGHDWSHPKIQRILRDRLADLASKGAHVMTTNSDTPIIDAMYTEAGFYIHRVPMPRRISATVDGRGRHHELIITSYEVTND